MKLFIYLFIEKPVKSTYNKTEHLKEKRKKEDTNYNKLNQQRKRITDSLNEQMGPFV